MAADYGDMAASRYFIGARSNAVRAVIGSGQQYPSVINNIDYVTMATLGNAFDFGDSTTAGYGAGASASRTRCVWGGDSSPGLTNTMDFVQIMTTGNAIDFGDLNTAARYVGATSNGGGGLN